MTARPLSIRRLDRAAPDFWTRLEALLAWEDESDDAVRETVAGILDDVRARGDEALVEYTERFDGWRPEAASDLALDPDALARAHRAIPGPAREALEAAADRIRAFHERQVERSWSYTEFDGTVLGQRISAIERAGVYVPGGKAAYPSSVLMNTLPARVAGVREIVMTVPAPGRRLNDLVLAAAHIGGVDRAFVVGGAQAVAALAYGTATVPRVDKIVGPGNVWVATAKRLVFGPVGIDMVAGPSEILVVCDGSTPPEWVAADLFSQAEHDEDARAMMICPEPAYLDEVERAMGRLLPALERADIIRASLAARGAFITVADLDEALEVANAVAPEHLELSVAEPEALLDRVRHAGAVFLGPYTSEVLGDYCAGPNHVLPTSRTARFSSPLGVYDFQKRTSVVHCSRAAAGALGRIAAELARGEGLTAHALSAELRRGEPPGPGPRDR